MRLMKTVAGSVLWLIADSVSVQNNLRGEAAKTVIPLKKGIQFSAHNVHAPYGSPPARGRQEGCHSHENGNLIRKMKRRMGPRLREDDNQ